MSKQPLDQGVLFNPVGGGFAPPPEEPDEDEAENADEAAAPVGDEQPDYDHAAPVEPETPYRGAWKDDKGMCSPTCPALRSVPGFSRPYSDCQVTGYRVEPTMWPCEIRSVYEAVKRGPTP